MLFHMWAIFMFVPEKENWQCRHETKLWSFDEEDVTKLGKEPQQLFKFLGWTIDTVAVLVLILEKR